MSFAHPLQKKAAKKALPPLTQLSRPIPEWLTTAVFYQIYPQSFFDTNGDGIGDLKGITAKLDYIKSLGATALWINPIFDSPFNDAGYDVRNYCLVAPRYGTNEDARELFQEAHRRGLRVVLDLVAGHTSCEHQWFRDSCASSHSKHADWYVWAEEEIPGGKWVESPGPRPGYYLKNYYPCQPALNYGWGLLNPAKPWQKPPKCASCMAVRNAMREVMRFWLDLGCDGFRVDMAASLIKEGDGQELHALWRDYRSWLRTHYPDAVIISEWSDPSHAIPAGFDIDFLLHFGNPALRYLVQPVLEHEEPNKSFFSRDGRGDITQFLDHFLPEYEATKQFGFIGLPTSNHDYGRPRSLGRGIDDLKGLYAMLLTLPGVPFLYYGNEIGMRNLPGWPDKEGARWRGSCRSPMQWYPGPKAGFSTADPKQFYLPIDPDPNRPTVFAQERDPTSLLAFTRRLLQLRAEEPSLGNLGGFVPLYARPKKYPFVYARSGGPHTFIIALNPTLNESSWSSPLMEGAQVVLSQRACLHGHRLEMGPVSFGIFRRSARKELSAD